MIFLTGSTGFIGRNLLPHLKQKGYPVRCFIRENSPTEYLKDACLDKVVGDILDESSLRYSMKGVDTVIHLAGVRMETGASSFEGVFYLGTRHVIDVAKAAGVKQFILFSTYGARPQAQSKFHHYKWMAEEYLRHSGLKFTIFRPTVIYGPYDHFVTRWARKLKMLPIVPVLGNGRNLLQPIAVADVIECVLRSLEDPTKSGMTYPLGGPDRMTFSAIIHKIGKVIGKRRPLFHWPLGMAKVFAYLMEMGFSYPPFTPDELLRWMEDRTCDHLLVEQEFKMKLMHFEEGLQKYFAPK